MPTYSREMRLMTTALGDGSSHLGTTTNDYTGCYFASHLGSDEDYSWDSPGWRTFFTTVAGKVVTLTGADRVLDVGCARGLLVQALIGAGADAYGIDISESAVASAHADIQGRLSVSSAVEPMEGSWDLVTCVEVVEHMSPLEADLAIANMCAVTDRVLFSSGPGDFAEPTHVNVRPPADWAAAFAEHGFFRRIDVDLSFLTPWAVLFERADLNIRAVVHRYETYAYPLRVEVLDKRAALLDAHRAITTLTDAQPSGELLELKHHLLTLRDHAVGAEAELGTARREHERMKREIEAINRDRDELRQSASWRVGQAVVSPLSGARRKWRARG